MENKDEGIMSAEEEKKKIENPTEDSKKIVEKIFSYERQKDFQYRKRSFDEAITGISKTNTYCENKRRMKRKIKEAGFVNDHYRLAEELVDMIYEYDYTSTRFVFVDAYLTHLRWTDEEDIESWSNFFIKEKDKINYDLYNAMSNLFELSGETIPDFIQMDQDNDLIIDITTESLIGEEIKKELQPIVTKHFIKLSQLQRDLRKDIENFKRKILNKTK